MSQSEDLYIILDIRRTASVNEIKKAFRRLARRYHPDINPGDSSAEERFKRISEAYEILSNPKKRSFYDENGFYTEGVLEEHSRPGWGFRFEGFDFSSARASGMDEFFGQVFGRTSKKREPQRGQDLEYQISLSFDQSLRGHATTIHVWRKVRCPVCQGTGRKVGVRDAVCGRCSGAGKNTVTKGLLQFALNCPDCGGTGRLIHECPECGGESRVRRDEGIDVQIPPGVSSGSRISFPGKGDDGPLGGPSGDLFVVTNVAPHPFFVHIGDNLHCVVPITITEAALGTKVKVPTIDGSALVRIPPGTQNGQTFRLRNKGAPSLMDSSARGDQYVEVRVVIPRIADERSKQILRELAVLNPEDPRQSIWK